MRVKVCGMRDEKNIQELVALKLDYFGFIFYEKSPRFVGNNNKNLSEFLKNIYQKKVGVFVNASTDFIIEKTQTYQLNLLQLHGGEAVDFCKNLKKKLSENNIQAKIIKVFPVGEDFDFKVLEDFEPYVSYFLFDTKGENLGGNGVSFDWEILQNYPLKTPFFLSGGIDLQHIEFLQKLKNLPLYALDINSRFEIKAGIKDKSKIQEFLLALENKNLEN